MSETREEDLVNILYTSGTTGVSKGVTFTNLMFHDAMIANDKVLNLSENDTALNFLPFTHVFERAWSYLCLAEGVQLYINLRPVDVLQSLQEVHPTCMCAVPRFWEKVYAGVQEKIRTSSPVQRALLNEALQVGKAYNVQYKMRGLQPPLSLKMRYKFFEKTVIALLKKTLGLENANFFPTAGAAIPPAVEEFVHAAGINMVAGYGLTESTATVSCAWEGLPKTIGSVGRVIDGVELKIGENLYVGESKGGIPDGEGLMRFSEDDPEGRKSYKGSWLNGKCHGKGTMAYTGGVYIGNFNAGTRSGFGIFSYPDGSRYEGNWVNDKMDGNGRFYYAKDDLDSRHFLNGYWKNGIITGEGRLFYKNGNYKVGIFVNGRMDGEWKCYDLYGTHIANQIFKNGIPVKTKRLNKK